MIWQAHAHVTPREAAGCVVHDLETGAVLLVQRHPNLAFMGGHYVFPGGKLEDSDTAAVVTGVEDAPTARQICAAVRETFEETGLLLAQGPTISDQDLARLHRDLLAEEPVFASFLQEQGLVINGKQFQPAGLWITPEFSPIRFNTQFFYYAVESKPAFNPRFPDGEICKVVWSNPAQIRQSWQSDEVALSSPISFMLRHLAAFPVKDVLSKLQQTPGRQPEIPNRLEPRRGVHIIPLKSQTLHNSGTTNCVILGEEEVFVIDPGGHTRDEQAHLCDHIDQLLAFGARIKAILLTHSHSDHVSGAARLQSRYQTPVWAQEKTADALQITVERNLRNNEILLLEGTPGWALRCLHTPGHHPGHLCFYEESTKTLLTGDMIANPGSVLIAPDHGGNMGDYINSLKSLLTLDLGFVIPGHGLPSFRQEGRQLLQKSLENRQWREERIKTALSAGINTVEQLFNIVYDDRYEWLRPLAVQQLQAHLDHLKQKGFPVRLED